jgi:hypothetical protein
MKIDKVVYLEKTIELEFCGKVPQKPTIEKYKQNDVAGRHM